MNSGSPVNSSGTDQIVTYEALNEALCRALFTTEMANRPVYLEITEEIQSQVASDLGIDPATLEDAIFESVNSKLHHSDLPTLFDSMFQTIRISRCFSHLRSPLPIWAARVATPRMLTIQDFREI